MALTYQVILILILTSHLTAQFPGRVGRSYQLGAVCDVKHEENTEISCNEVIHTRPSPYHKCCKDKLFDSRTESCCNGEPYNTETHTCCMNYDMCQRHFCSKTRIGTERKPVPGKGGLCCGDNVMDRNTQKCCNGILYNRTISTKECCNPETKHTPLPEIKCGENVINQMKDICCGGVALPHENGKFRCCGLNKTYDQTKEICCHNDEIMTKLNPDDDDCCNGQTYNSKKKICCHDSNLISKTNEGDNVCCGTSSYNFLSEQRCCNGMVYNVRKELCCNDEIVKRANDQTECCGNDMYNWNSEICCDGVVYAEGSGVCCPVEGRLPNRMISKFYPGVNSTTHTCCGLELVTKEEAEDPNRICCNHNYGKFGCCGPFPINTTTESCCGEQIIPKSSDGKVGCCMRTFTLYEISCTGRRF